MNLAADLCRIEPISSRLSPAESSMRLRLMERIIDHGGPISVSNLTPSAEAATGNLLSELVRKRALVLDDQQQACFVYPVSAHPTCHRVSLADGRSFYAMCAIDAMGSAFTFRQDVAISSHCSLCTEPVSLNICNGRITELQPATTHVLHIDLNKFNDWAGNC